MWLLGGNGFGIEAYERRFEIQYEDLDTFLGVGNILKYSYLLDIYRYSAKQT